MVTKISGKYILAYKNGSHSILKDGVVVIEDDKIIFTGRHYNKKTDIEIDASDKIICPGLINMHTLASNSVTYLTLDGSNEALSINYEYINNNTREMDLSSEEIQICAKFALMSAIKGGATTVVPITPMAYSLWESPQEQAEITADTAGELGLRAYVSHQYRSSVKYKDTNSRTHYKWRDDEETGLKHAVSFCKKYQDTYNHRIKTMLFPYQFETCSPELLKKTSTASKDLQVKIHMHTAEFTNQFHESLRRYGKTPVAKLYELGLLGENTILTHVLHTSFNTQSGFSNNDRSDIELLANTGTTVVRCPVLYSRGFAGRSSLQSFYEFTRNGVNMTLGTDTYPMDMLGEMRQGAILGKAADGAKIHPTAADVFNAATLNAAKALGRTDIGRIETGAKADIIIIDPNKIGLALMDDPVKSIVYMANQGDIDSVIIDGKIIVENGIFTNNDSTGMFEEVQRINQKQKKNFVKYNPLGKSEEELFPPSYPSFDDTQ